MVSVQKVNELPSQSTRPLRFGCVIIISISIVSIIRQLTFSIMTKRNLLWLNCIPS